MSCDEYFEFVFVFVCCDCACTLSAWLLTPVHVRRQSQSRTVRPRAAWAAYSHFLHQWRSLCNG